MRKLWLVVCLAAPMLMPAMGGAEALKIGGCDLSSPGISSRQRVLTFIEQLQAAVKAEKKAEVAAMVRYPIHVTLRGKKAAIKDAVAFEKSYSGIMTKGVREGITGQKPETLFCNYQGVMLGNGEIWFHEQTEGKDKGKLKIIAINN